MTFYSNYIIPLSLSFSLPLSLSLFPKRKFRGKQGEERDKTSGGKLNSHFSWYVIHLYYSLIYIIRIVIASSSLARSLNRSTDNFSADKKLIIPTFNKCRRIIYPPTSSFPYFSLFLSFFTDPSVRLYLTFRLFFIVFIQQERIFRSIFHPTNYNGI